jgi:DNA polymerase-1
MHNAKFDLAVLRQAGIDVQGLYFDTMIAASLIVPEWQKVGLKALSQTMLNEQMLSFADVVEAQKYPDFSHVPLATAVAYAAADAHQTFKLWRILEGELEKHNVLSLYRDLEHPLLAVLCAMEQEGIPCDCALLGELEEKARKELALVEQEIYGLTGALPGSLNLNSPKQLEQLLFGTLQLPPQKMSAKKTGYSTDQEVLEILAKLHVVPRLILRHRELAKLRGTYLIGLAEAVNKKTQKIHTSFSQTNVATGRLASSNPNLQNIPVQVGEITVRSAFQAPPGYVFISADYSQIELRVLAHLAHDKGLIEAFAADRDIHAQTAAKLFNIAAESVSQEQRQIGKRINFSIMYGLTPYGLSRDLNISATDAKRYIDTFFSQYPGVKIWMDAMTQQAIEKGYVTTWFGRRRFIPGIYEKNKHLFEAARRVAINTPAQGTAAEIMKLGMIRVHERLVRERLDAQLLVQIHDELLIKVTELQVEQAKAIIKETLEQVVTWDVPLRVTMRVGKTWQEVTK